MRRLATRFAELGQRPVWVPPDVDRTIHFDQLLHGYYYHSVMGSDLAGAETRKSKERVDLHFDRNRARPDEALRDAARWWASLRESPTQGGTYNEERFITEVAPRLRELFAPSVLPTLNREGFVEAMTGVYAFRDHGWHVDNATLGLPPGTELDAAERITAVARWMYDQRTATGRTPIEVLMFVIHDRSIPRAEDRIWTAMRDPAWRIPHLGKSALGEVLGWARPSDYPPRNDRTNKALRALGHDVVVFGE